MYIQQVFCYKIISVPIYYGKKLCLNFYLILKSSDEMQAYKIICIKCEESIAHDLLKFRKKIIGILCLADVGLPSACYEYV